MSKNRLTGENVRAVERGLANLDRHARNVEQMGVPFVIAINRFHTDTEAEMEAIRNHCDLRGWRVALCDVWAHGGEGGRELGEAVLQALEQSAQFTPNYTAEMGLLDKLNAVVTRVYGGEGVTLSPEAETQRKWLESHGLGHLRICIAKTQYSFSDDPKGGGAPTNFKINVRSLQPSAGAGFVVAFAGEIMTMPGLPRSPRRRSHRRRCRRPDHRPLLKPIRTCVERKTHADAPESQWLQKSGRYGCPFRPLHLYCRSQWCR